MQTKTATKTSRAAIVKELRKHGASVQELGSLVAPGIPDLLISINGITALVAIIEPDRALPCAMAEFGASWQGRIMVLDSVDGVGGLIEALTGGR